MKPLSKPVFTIGAIVANDKFAGTIISAFYADKHWNYNIGENATIEKDPELGHRFGPKYMRENSILYMQQGGKWLDVKA